MSRFVPTKEDLRSSLLFCYLLRKTPSQAHTMLVKAYGTHSPSENQCDHMFDKFREENIQLLGRGKQRKIRDYELQALLDEDNSQSLGQLGDSLSACAITISSRLKALGLTKKQGLWVPKELGEEQLKTRKTSCETLFAKLQAEPFLDRAVIGDRKWIYLEEPKRKIILCVWWDQHGLIYHELLQSDERANIDLYHQQIISLNNSVHERRPKYTENNNKVILLYCHAPSDASTLVEDTFKSLGWETYEAYPPDLAPSTHLFASMDLTIAKQFFISQEQVQTWLDDWFRLQGDKYHFEIHNLPEIWKACINKQGDYIR